MPDPSPSPPRDPGPRTIRYVRHHGPWHDPEPFENPLLAFIYDIPYFGACGVFPPFHLLNQFLLHGGSQGGMSPGATWESFSLSLDECHHLADAVRTTPLESLRDRARYAHLPFTFDPAFDGHPATYPVHAPTNRCHRSIPPEQQDYFAWSNAISAKHRAHRHAQLRRADFLKVNSPQTKQFPIFLLTPTEHNRTLRCPL